MEVEVDADLITLDEESSSALVRRSSKAKSVNFFRENGSNRTVKRESEITRDSVTVSDEKPLDAPVRDSLMADSDNNKEENGANGALMLRTAKDDKLSLKMNRDVGVAERLLQNAEERTGGERFEASRVKVTKHSELNKSGPSVNLKSIHEGSNGYSTSSSMGSTNASEVMAMPFDSPDSKVASETSVHFVEKEGSESTEPLERGGASRDYESKKTDFEKSEKVIQSQTMTEIKKNQKWSAAEENREHNLIDLETSTGAFIAESCVTSKFNHSEKREKGKNVCLDTHVFSDTVSTVTVRNGDLTINKEEEKAGNGGFKQHEHGISVFESARQNSHNSALNDQDERELNWTTIQTEFEGKVEVIIKEQQSDDLVCPFCRKCITERVILRKRKRTNVVSYGRLHKETTDDVQPIVSEGEHDVAENQNDQAEILNEDIEAYGCLACFSLFFQRGVKLFATKSDSAKSRSGSGSLSEQYPSEVHQESAQFIDREKESFRCLPFIYAWGQSNNKASSSGATDDFTSETSAAQHVKAAECIGKSSGSTLIHDGMKATKVDVVGLNEDKASIRYGNFESQLNLGKNHAAVQEFATTVTSQSTSSSAKTIQNMTFEASPTTGKSQMDTTSTESTIAEAIYRSTEATKSAVAGKGKSEFLPYVKEDSESGPQSEEFHFMTEGQVVQPHSDISGSLDDEIRQDVGINKVLNESASVKQSEKQPLYQEDVKGIEDQRSELHFNESIKPLEMPREIDASVNEDGIRPHLVRQDQVLNNSSTVPGVGELPTPEEEPKISQKPALRQGESDSKDKSCNCIPVSIPAIWSIWSTKKSPTDEQLKEPLLPKVGDETFDKVLPDASKDDSGEEISALKSGSADSSILETLDPASLAQSKVNGSFSPSSEIARDSGKIVLPSHAAVETVIVVEGTSDPQSSISATVVPEFGNTSPQVPVSSVATEWDLLKSVVYGGLTVSITSLGVVSSAAGGDAKTLTVIAIGLANLVSGLFLIFNNILDLNHYHQEQFIETVGHSFWFNGFVAVFSYLLFGSLASVTYGFSFQKSDDTLYKFLAASIVSLVSIILLALGKARVTKKSYIRLTILYIVAGFGASIMGFFAGEYIKKLLEKWGIVTD